MPRSPRRWLARIGRWPRLAAAGVCLLLAAVSALDARRPQARAAPERTVAVVVAVRDLPAGHVLARRDVAVARLPSSARLGGSFDDADLLAGRRLAGALTRREPVTAVRLLGRDITAGLDEGTVAVPVTLDSDVDQLVHAGDRVDLIATPHGDDTALDTPVGRQQKTGKDAHPSARDGTVVVAQRARVLAVLAPDPDGDPGAGTQLVLAGSRELAVQIATLRASSMFTVVGESP